MSCLAFCNMRTGSWKCGIYFSRVHSLLLLILHLSQVRVSITRQDIWTFLKKSVRKVQGREVLVEPEGDTYGAEHWGASKWSSGDREDSSEGKKQRLFRAKSCLIWLFISSKAGFSPDGCSTNSQIHNQHFCFAYQVRESLAEWWELGPEGMWERKSDTEKGFIFSVQQLSDWQVLLTFLAWEGKASWITATPIPPTLKTGLETYIPQNSKKYIS